MAGRAVVTEVRLATWADRAAIAAIRRVWTEERDGGPVDDEGFVERFESWLEREQHQRLTWLGFSRPDGTEANDAVAMLNLLAFTRMPRPGHPEPSVWGYLANFYVAPDHRGSGLGTRMLAECTSYADQHGFVRIVLSPTERSVPLYDRAGFVTATSLLLRPRP